MDRHQHQRLENICRIVVGSPLPARATSMAAAGAPRLRLAGKAAIVTGGANRMFGGEVIFTRQGVYFYR
jgi:hypothetical protein